MPGGQKFLQNFLCIILSNFLIAFDVSSEMWSAYKNYVHLQDKKCPRSAYNKIGVFDTYCRLGQVFVFVDPNAVKRIFDLYFYFIINRVVIFIAEDYELDLTEGGFPSLLGYEKKVLK